MKSEFQRRVEAHRVKADALWNEVLTVAEISPIRFYTGEVRGFRAEGLVLYARWCEMTKCYRLDESRKTQERLRRQMLRRSWKALQDRLSETE